MPPKTSVPYRGPSWSYTNLRSRSQEFEDAGTYQGVEMLSVLLG